MSKDIRNEKLWDDYFKAISDKMRNHLIPLINEAFETQYSMKESEIELIQTEYKVPIQEEGHYSTILNDITILINKSDCYHLECQMNNDGDFSIRLLEYDFHVALSQSRISKNYIRMRFPRSVVVFPDLNEQLPHKIQVILEFADNTTHDYYVNAIHVQDYTITDIMNKELYLFLPFVLIRFKNRVISKNNPLTVKELSDFMEEVSICLESAYAKGDITDLERKEYMSMIKGAAERVFYKRRELSMEVKRMTERSYKLLSEQLEEKDELLREKDEQHKEDIKRIEELQKEIERLKKQKISQ